MNSREKMVKKAINCLKKEGYPLVERLPMSYSIVWYGLSFPPIDHTGKIIEILRKNKINAEVHSYAEKDGIAVVIHILGGEN